MLKNIYERLERFLSPSYFDMNGGEDLQDKTVYDVSKK